MQSDGPAGRAVSRLVVRPSGPLLDALLVGVGLIAVGGGSVVALAVAARVLDAQSFATFATWWTTASLAGLCFFVVEQYLPRLILERRSSGQDERPVVHTFTRGTLLGAASATVLAALGGGWLVRTLFDGLGELLLLGVAYMLLLALQTLQRAVAVGRGRFHVFTLQMGADGVVRVLGAAALGLSGRTSAVPFAVVFVAAAATGVLAGALAGRRWLVWTGPAAAVSWQPLVLLAVTSIGPLAVNNVGVPWLTASGQTSAATVGAVAGALTLSRIPTMFAGAAFGPVLAPLAAAVDARERLAFHAVHRRAAAAAWGLSAAFTLVFTIAGPFLLSRYLGPGFRLPRPELAAMAAGSGLMLLCGVEQAALVALSAWTWSAIGWAVGLASFALVLVLPVDPPLRLACAVLVAPLVAVLVMSAARRSAQRSGRVFSA